MVNYLHNMRGLAIFFVVLQHSIFMMPYDVKVEFPVSFVLLNSTYLFVTIAGYFFSMLSQRYSYSGYIRSKLDNVIFPYVFVSIPAVFIYVMGYKIEHSWMDVSALKERSPFIFAAYMYLTGAQLGPFWFIPMITIFYVLFPVFKWINANRVYTVVAFLISLVCGYFVGRPELNDNAALSFVYFCSAYLLGFLLYQGKYHENVSRLNLIIMIPIVLLIYWMVFENGYSHANDLICRILWVFAIFAFFRLFFDQKNVVLGYLGDKSFFIFFIHGYFIAIFRMLEDQIGLNWLEFSIVVFSASIFLSWVSFKLLKAVFRGHMRRFFGAG